MTGPNDLKISRIIKAPPALVWDAWVDPRSLEQWWLPAPHRCKVLKLDVRPGGGFETHMSEGGDFKPHVNACFLDVQWGKRLVFTTALVANWRPASDSFMAITAAITFKDHSTGTEYEALVLHKDDADSKRHVDMGFFDGWGTCIEQLSGLVESRVQ